MNYSESLPLNDRYDERDVAARDLDAGRHSDQRAGTAPRRSRSYRSSDFKNAQSRSDRPSTSRRLTRSFARVFLAVLIGVGATLAWQSYGGEMVRAWAPSLGWLLPVSPSAELQAQLKPVALDLAIMRRSVEQRWQSRSTRAQARPDGAGLRDTAGSRAGHQSEYFSLGPACTEGGPCPAA